MMFFEKVIRCRGNRGKPRMGRMSRMGKRRLPPREGRMETHGPPAPRVMKASGTTGVLSRFRGRSVAFHNRGPWLQRL